MKTIYNGLLRVTILAAIFISVFFKSNATIHVVTVQNFVFTPSAMNINLGDTVKWQFVNGTHTTTSTTIPAGAAAWNSNINVGTPTFTYKPAVLGTYNYKCNIHPLQMIASFTVVCPTTSVTISAGGPTAFCKPGSVLLSISSSSGGPFTAFQWKKGANNVAGETNSTFNATKAGSYKLMVTNGCGNSATSNTIPVTVNPKPEADFTQGNCNNGKVLLTRTGTPTTGVTFKWKLNGANIPGATNSTFSATVTGGYKVEVKITATGCKKTSPEHTVTINCKLGQENPEVTAYPNPSLDFFVMNTSSPELQNGYINVYDLAGKLLEHVAIISETTEVAGNLPPGVYFARVEVNGEIKETLKLLKVE